jgi:hypothetical protein
MASSDVDEFGRGIESALDEASDTSDSVDARLNIRYKRLLAFK